MKIDRDLQIALAIHNAGIRRARREYAAHPTAACPWRPLEHEHPCENLTDGINLCADHLASKRVCRTCHQRQAEKRRRQCSTCAHGGLQAAAERVRLRRARARRKAQ